jgi:ATP-binding cassette subfamily B protein
VKPIAALRKAVRSYGTVVKLGFGAAPGRVTLTVLAQLVQNAFVLAASFAVKFVVQEAVERHVAGAIWAAAALAGAAGASAVAYVGYINLLPKMHELVRLKLDTELIRLANRIPTLEYHDRPAFADKLSLVRQSRGQLVGSVQMIGNAANTLLLSVGAFTIMASVDARFLILPLFAVPRLLTGARARALTRRLQDESAERLRLRGHIFGRIASAAAGKEIRVFGLQRELADRFAGLTRTIQHQRDVANWGNAAWLVLGDVSFMAAYVAAIGWIVVRAARGESSVGDVVLTTTMAATLVGAINSMAAFSLSVPMVMITAERFHWLEDFAEDARAAGAAAEPPPPRITRCIEVDAVSFTYPDRDTPALSDVSLELPAGGVIALVGENGSGKSTLVKLLCGFYRPTAGRILIDGQDLANIEVDAWRARISAAFQDFANLEFLLHESVGVGDLGQLGRKHRVSAALGRSGGAALAELPPSGLDTMLGRKWGGTELSGGQWQQLALARALVRERPLLIVFDEPTAALDAAAEHEMFARFAAEARSGEAAGRVTLLISHRFSTVRMADAIAVLEKGRLQAFGTHEQLMAAGGLYAELFELQARAYR